MGDTADGSYTASQLGGYIRREEAKMAQSKQVRRDRDKILEAAPLLEKAARILGGADGTVLFGMARQLREFIGQTEDEIHAARTAL